MIRGLIKGKDAREYAEKVKFSEKSKKFDKFILDNIKLRNPKVCDLCCGPGNTIELLSSKANEIVGVDASDEMIRICNEKFANNSRIKIIQSSATKTELKETYFDYVVVRMGLHHIKNKEDLLNEIYRILKPTGKLILIDKYYKNKYRYYLKETLKLILKFDKHLLNHFVISKKENFNLFKKFRILKEEYLPDSQKKTTQTFMLLLEKV